MDIKYYKFPDKIIIDKEIVLRLKNIDHYEEFIRVASKDKDHLVQWLPWAKEIPNEKSEEHYKNSPKQKKENEEVNWTIFYNNQLAGAIGIMNRGSDGSDPEIGYWLAETYEGKGIITKSVNKLAELIFTLSDAEFVEIGCDIRNENSANVAKRCGFTFVKNINRPTHIETPMETASIYRLYR